MVDMEEEEEEGLRRRRWRTRVGRAHRRRRREWGGTQRDGVENREIVKNDLYTPTPL